MHVAKEINIVKEGKKSKPKRRVKRDTKNWFNNDCLMLRNDYIRVKNVYKSNKTQVNKDKYIAKGKVYKRMISKTKKMYVKQFEKDIRNLRSSNPKEYWNIVNRSASSKSVVDKVSKESFLKHFRKLSQKKVDTTNDVEQDFDLGRINRESNQFINNLFSVDEIRLQVNKLKTNKASGVDLIINEFIKHSPDNLNEVLTCLFNLVLQSGVVPTEWSIGMIFS